MITTEFATVYRSSLKGRRYLTKAAAIKGEARIIIKDKYPTEDSDRDEMGRVIFGGWHWRELKNSEKLYRRVCRLVGRANSF